MDITNVLGAHGRTNQKRRSMKITVTRDKFDDLSTEGTMFVDGVTECFTLEPGKKDPQRPKGPIPVGTYVVVMSFSPHFNQKMPHLQNVPGFTDVMIHWGNFEGSVNPETGLVERDSLGCIMVGETQGTDFVGSSKDAFGHLLTQILAHEGDITITIQEMAA
jgi:Steigviridae/Suoliviridae L,D-carboxypeptidase/transpeptidase